LAVLVRLRYSRAQHLRCWVRDSLPKFLFSADPLAVGVGQSPSQ
jgi:hypothetical protein